MIYLDTSVALAHLLAEDRQPAAEIWAETLVSSRLLEYELWTTLHRRGLAKSHGEAARALISRLAMLELAPTVLRRALEPFEKATQVRTLDALHLASCAYLVELKQRPTLATYDRRLAAAAEQMELPLLDLDG